MTRENMKREYSQNKIGVNLRLSLILANTQTRFRAPISISFLYYFISFLYINFHLFSNYHITR